MKMISKLKKWLHLFVLNLFEEETYEEDFRRNFSLKYMNRSGYLR